MYMWPTVFWRANPNRKPRFKHLATRVTTMHDAAGCCAGHTLWCRSAGKVSACLGWDWIEMSRGVFAMVDPMHVVTNMQILTANGDVLGATDAALHLNQFVRSLPWQDEVRSLLNRMTQ
jgi:hypothetical protein